LPEVADSDLPLTIHMSGDFSKDLSGLKGAIAHARIVKEVLDWVHATPGSIELGDPTLSRVANTGNRLSHYSNDLSNFNKLVDNFTTTYDWAIETVKNTKPRVDEPAQDWDGKPWDYRLAYSLDMLYATQL